MRMTGREVRGEHGWIILAIYVWAWDMFAPETLSRALWRALQHPVHKWWVVGLWAWVSSHLLLKRPVKILWRW